MNVRTSLVAWPDGSAAPGLDVEAFSIPEAARRAGISRTKLYELIAAGQLATVKVGRRRLVRPETLRRLLADLED